MSDNYYADVLSKAAGISARRSPYDPSFNPGEATIDDVRASVVDLFLSGLGMLPSASAGVGLARGSRRRPFRSRDITGGRVPMRPGQITQQAMRTAEPAFNDEAIRTAYERILPSRQGLRSVPIPQVLAAIRREHPSVTPEQLAARLRAMAEQGRIGLTRHDTPGTAPDRELLLRMGMGTPDGGLDYYMTGF